MPSKTTEKIRCSFCGKSQGQVRKLIAGSANTFICDECVELCGEILEEELAGDNSAAAELIGNINLQKPREMKEFLDEYVIGQERAKKVLAVAVYNHYKRVLGKVQDIEVQKSNILMIGPTGSGKTYLAQSMARMLGVPFAIADATSLTEAGYVGEDVENILLKLIQAADMDIKKAELGIIYIDEIDKITKKSENVSITRDASGEGVQQALLKIIEGTVASVPPQGGRKHPHQEMMEIDTTNILFICGGAFDGLEKIVDQRVSSGSIGFGAEVYEKNSRDIDELLSMVETQDLVKFGLIPEFVGRVPINVTLDLLDEDALVRILTEPRNALVKQYQKLFEIDGVKLEFTEEAIRAVAQLAVKRKTGARGLRSIMESTMMDIMYEIPSRNDIDTVTITAECVNDHAAPELGFIADSQSGQIGRKPVDDAAFGVNAAAGMLGGQDPVGRPGDFMGA